METAKTLILSFLLSREEYMRFSAAFEKQERKKGAFARQLLGVLAFSLGLFLLLFGDNWGFSQLTGGSVAVLGLFFIVYDLLFAGFLYESTAAAEYESSRSAHTSKKYTLTPDALCLEEGESFLKLPLSLLSRVTETAEGYILSFEGIYVFFIPFRVMNEQEKALFKTLLKQN